MPFLVLSTLASAASAFADEGGTKGSDNSSDSYAIGLWGDLPYSDVQAAAIRNLIADMNDQHLAFSVHDGDLKAGSNNPCNDALYANSLAFFDQLQSAAMFTPGDNDWTDCDCASNGGYSSRERLDHERQLFFSTPLSMGQKRITQDVQNDALCSCPRFVQQWRRESTYLEHIGLKYQRRADVALEPNEELERPALDVTEAEDDIARAFSSNP